MARTSLLAALLSTQIASLATADPIKIVDPPELTNEEGNKSAGGATFGFRNQFISHSTVFANLPAGGAWLVGIADRADAGQRRPVTVSYRDMKIVASTTELDRLGAVFADNYGPDTVTVIDGPLELTYEVNDEPPHPFSGIWHFDVPYHYDPVQGNLLLDRARLGLWGHSSCLSLGQVMDVPSSRPTIQHFIASCLERLRMVSIWTV